MTTLRARRLSAWLAAGVLAAGLLAVPGTSGGSTFETGPTAATLDGDAPAGSVTLITGDRVTLSGDGHAAVVPDPERASVPVTTFRRDSDVYVVPADAAPLIGSGRLDPQLFNLTALLSASNGAASALPLIVTRAGQPLNVTEDRLVAAGAQVTRTLPAVSGMAVRVDLTDPHRFWSELTSGQPLASGDRVWLDRPYRLLLSQSVPQVGAPDAWDAGYDGTGTTVAIVDSGIDTSHPDLAGRVAGQANFTDEPDADLNGHGTHVAATVAGSGLAGGATAGANSGVAPGATLLDAKVCDAAGDCTLSAIIAGMQWAAEQGADVVNVSLGGPDTPGVDPLEAAVDSLTASHDTLFVIAAGNVGGPGMVGSPATADAALAVGAVDQEDELAAFSGQGPRRGDAGLKPEITAPGVAIEAARSQDSERPGEAYTSLTGTSMAAPHVAGAAAILAQAHPDWSAEQLKAALMGAASPDPDLSAYAQGAGRLRVGAALDVPVVAEPPAIGLGFVELEAAAGDVLERTVTYHNPGDADQVLELSVREAGSTPTGLFGVGQQTLTVPAQGSAEVTLTAAVGMPEEAGRYTGWLVATAGGMEVVTPVGFERAVPLTITHTGRDGDDPAAYATFVMRVDGPEQFILGEQQGEATVWVPAGTYMITSSITDLGPDGEETTILTVPRVEARTAQSFDLDARAAQPIQITVADADAELWSLEIGFQLDLDSANGFSITSGVRDGSAYTAPVVTGEPLTGFRTKITSNMHVPGPDGDEHAAPVVYHLGWFLEGAPPVGFTRHVTGAALADVEARHVAHAAGGIGYKTSTAQPSSGTFTSGITFGLPFPLPFERTERYLAGPDIRWVTRFAEHVEATGDRLVSTETSPLWYEPATVQQRWWNRPVHGPGLANPVYASDWVSRFGDDLRFLLPLFGDGDGHAGRTDAATVEGTVTISHDGEILHEGPYEPDFGRLLTLPPEAGTYQITAAAQRGAPAELSTAVHVEWTFESEHVSGTEPLRQPLWTVQLTPPLDASNGAPAGGQLAVPVRAQAQPGSPAGELAELAVEVSFDDGATWQPVLVEATAAGHVAQLVHPAQPGHVSLRASATDTAGNAVTQEVIRAYRIG